MAALSAYAGVAIIDRRRRRADPDSDGAALAAADYPCRAGDDLGIDAVWMLGISSYNSSQRYLETVAEGASGYGASD